MSVDSYEEKRRKEREALDEQFKAAAAPLADQIAQEIEKATGEKLKRSVREGSYAITLSFDEPRITVEISHDWGAGHGHWTRLPTGKPKIDLNVGGYRSGGKSWYRPDKDGKFNIAKIVEKVTYQVESYKSGVEATRRREIDDKANAEAQAKEMKGVVFPGGSDVQRAYDHGYIVKFGGKFILGSVAETKELAEALNALVAKYKFEKAWRTDF